MSIQRLIARDLNLSSTGHVRNHSEYDETDWWLSALSDRFMPEFQINQGLIRDFIRSWLKNLEQKNNPAWVASHLRDLMDLDLTTDELLPSFVQQMVPQIKIGKVDIDLRFFLKNIRKILAKRGTIEAVTLLFRLLGDEVEIFTPSDWMLGSSDDSYVSSKFRLTDGNYFTPFTYDLKSRIDPDIWYDFIESICHPHGMIMFRTHIVESTMEEEVIEDTTLTQHYSNNMIIHRQSPSPLCLGEIGSNLLHETRIHLGAPSPNSGIDITTPLNDTDETLVGHIKQNMTNGGVGIIRSMSSNNEMLYVEALIPFKPNLFIGNIESVTLPNQITLESGSDIGSLLQNDYIIIRGKEFEITNISSLTLTLDTGVNTLLESFIDEPLFLSYPITFGDGTASIGPVHAANIYTQSPWSTLIFQGIEEILLDDLEQTPKLNDPPVNPVVTEITISEP